MKTLIQQKINLNSTNLSISITKRTLELALFGIPVTLLLLMFFIGAHVARADEPAGILSDINKINAPEIVAKNAVVYDIENKEFIYAKNANESVPMASLAKIITAKVFLQLSEMRAKQGNPIKAITISKNGDGFNAGDRGLVDGEVWRTENLIRYMLITSSNIAAKSLASSLVDDEFVFSLLMNGYVKDLGFRSFSFKNSSGLSISNPSYKLASSLEKQTPQISSAFGSAKEIAVLFSSIFNETPFLGRASIIPEATFINLSGNTHTITNVNYSIFQIPNIVAGKTGTTEESGGNLVIVINVRGHEYAIVILGSTIEDRYTDAVKLTSSTEAFATLK
jgi:D-alanyl-D-alanine carboxypeptidase (penicillin-binding protein 5/6)